MRLNICNLGRIDYAKALGIQCRLLAKRQAGQIGDTLLLVEHPPVLTLGTRGRIDNIHLSEEALRSRGVEVVKVYRGGDVTYHGPGQVVGYPIMEIEQYPGCVHGFVEGIETALIRMVSREYGLDAHKRLDEYTGVWIEHEKIAAIGIGIKKWVTLHGFALNVNTDLTHFDWINPCGLSLGVTSVQAQVGHPVDFDEAMRLAGEYLSAGFGKSPVPCRLEDLLYAQPTEGGKP